MATLRSPGSSNQLKSKRKTKALKLQALNCKSPNTFIIYTIVYEVDKEEEKEVPTENVSHNDGIYYGESNPQTVYECGSSFSGDVISSSELGKKKMTK